MTMLILAAAVLIFVLCEGIRMIRRNSHMVSNCGSDENGEISGGEPGDQTGKEWCIRAWDDRPWTCVLRYPDAGIRDDIALLAKESAENDRIGYNQDARGTYWQELKDNGYDPAKITSTCDADCSSGTAAIVKAVGFRNKIEALENTGTGLTTKEMRAAFEKEGFEVLTDGKYLKSPDWLLPGDIILYENHHVEINLTKGDKAGKGTEE